jgi:hypothetical protein
MGSGLFRCGVCGSVVLVTSTSRRGRDVTPSVYRCRATRGHVSVAAEHVDAHVDDVMRALLADPAVTASLAPAEGREEVTALRDELTTVRTRLEQLADSYADGYGFDPAQLMRANTRLGERKREIEDRLAAIARRDATSRLVADDNTPGAWGALSADEKRPILRALVDVTIQPAARLGRQPGGQYFDPARVQVIPRGDADGHP